MRRNNPNLLEEITLTFYNACGLADPSFSLKCNFSYVYGSSTVS